MSTLYKQILFIKNTLKIMNKINIAINLDIKYVDETLVSLHSQNSINILNLDDEILIDFILMFALNINLQA
jgi:hypothetical protein